MTMAKGFRQILFVASLCFAVTVGGAHGARSTALSSSSNGATARALAETEGPCKSLVEPNGYECQEHHVTTEDGYILSMQRIPEGRSKTGGAKKPVLLQHGVLVDGASWLLNSPDDSLAYVMADAGFDVWIANSRGTKWSLGHTSLTTREADYWDWSWDELAGFELPALVQYVFDQTGQKLNYVGHSQGALIALASLSQGKLVDKLSAIALLCPIAYMSHITSLLLETAVQTFAAEDLYGLGVREFNLNEPAVRAILKTICKNPAINCYDLLPAVTGENCCLNASTVNRFLDYEPQSISTKNLIHFSQMIRRGTITKFDYGNYFSNIKHYGRLNPPAYTLSNIPHDLPLFLGYGGKDALSDVFDVDLLRNSLKSHDAEKLTLQYSDNYAHTDYIMAVNAKEVVYTPMISFFNRF